MERSFEIKLIIHGIKLKEAYEGQLFTAKKCEFIDLGESVPNCIQIDYKGSIKADPSVCEQQYINREIPRVVDLFTQSLSLLLRCPAHLIGYIAKLDGVAVEPKLLRYAPNLYNLAKMFHQDVPIPSELSVSLSGDFWRVLENTISAYHQNQYRVGNCLALALRWFKKGSDELDSSDRLVAFWISFNALYANRKIREQKAIENYVCKNMEPEIARRYVIDNMTGLRVLSGFPIMLGVNNKTPVAEELYALLNVNQIDYTAVAKKSVLVIYGIRNNLFHGDYDPVSEDAQNHVATAESLLSYLASNFIAKEMTGKPFIRPKVPYSLNLGSLKRL